MKLSFYKCALLLLISSSLVAQVNDPVLMIINGNPIYKSEFEYIYNKNNSNNLLDKKTLDEYVDLFINFKLKVEEAKAQGIDTTTAFINELKGYRAQLAKPYLTDQKLEEALIKEAYDRMKEDVEVSHILVRIPQNATPADTLTAWNKIKLIQKQLEKEDFAKVAREMSEDEMAEKTGGYIGWITAFQTPYSFESMAYNTPVGSISKPVRTSFGYHIIKVHNRRNSPGEVLVAHIMRFTSNDSEKNKRAKEVIDSLYQRILAGDDFGTLAKNYSEDKPSASRQGELPWFGTGRMIPEFEKAAFALKNIGDVSEPIQTPFGWHIIKLLDKRNLPSFEKIKPDLERRLKYDERGKLPKQSFLKKLKIEYNYQVIPESVEEFYKLAEGHSLNDSIFLVNISKLNKPLFSFADRKYTQQDLANYIKKNPYTQKTIPTEMINEKLNEFVDNELLNYEDSQLEKKYDDFRLLMQEYHDGILLFEISNREVWEKAVQDTMGLANYFNQHKSDYKWSKPHFKGLVIYCKDKNTFKTAKLIAKRSPEKEIEKNLLNRLNDSIQYVKIEKGLFVQGDNKAVDKFIFKVKDNYTPPEGYPYVFVHGRLLKSPEDYTDVRGAIISDYQDYLEKEWIKKLRTKYPFYVDKDVLKTVKEN
ncbi:MAG TPA: peptidylprolyl isomerase [Paludibacteraceae bacterium]|nr:peptidylprolyl isomerase [Paludibacteraceae bacterium]